jgi:hypothetical protein
VNKYKILDQKTLLCNLANEMLKWNGNQMKLGIRWNWTLFCSF